MVPTGDNKYYGVLGVVGGGSGYNYGVFGRASGTLESYAG